MEALNLITRLPWEGAAAGRLRSGVVVGIQERARFEVGKSRSFLPCRALAGGCSHPRCPDPPRSLLPSWGTSPWGQLDPPSKRSQGGMTPGHKGWHARCLLHMLVTFTDPYVPRGQAETQYYPTEVVSLLDTSSPGGRMQEGARTSSP